MFRILSSLFFNGIIKVMRKEKFIWIMVAIFASFPLVIYFYNFRYGLSKDASDWAAFGSYAGGIYGAMAFVVVAISIHLTRTQFFIQHEEDAFYKSVESLQARIMVTQKHRGVELFEASVAKALTDLFQDELKKLSSHMARNVLCKCPEKISDTNLEKMVESISSHQSFPKHGVSKELFIDEIRSRQLYEDRWEYLKSVFGAEGGENDNVKAALQDVGCESFYKTDFYHRRYYYDRAWEIAEQDYSEEVSIYVRKMRFILSHIYSARRRKKYEKYFLSQISKYDIVFIYCYSLVHDESDILKMFSECGLLNEVNAYECRQVLFDSPSEEEVTFELNKIEARVDGLSSEN